MKAKR